MSEEQAPATGVLRAVADGFSNLAARVGLRANNQSAAGRYDYSYVTRDRITLENAYTSSWVVGRGVDVYAEDMTRAGVDLHSTLPPDQVDVLHKTLRDIQFWEAAREAITWARLYGGALLVALIDGQNVATPLNPRAIRKGQFRGFAVLDRWQVDTFGEPFVQALGPDLGKPEFYRVESGSAVFPGQRLHHSRVARIEGIRLPPRRRAVENGWGMSIVERLYERAVALDSATLGMSQLVYKAHLRTLKVDGYKTALAVGGEQGVNAMLARLDLIRLMQSNEGMTVLDKNDEFITHQYNFNGLPDVIDKLTEQVCGALQIPFVRLIGQSPKGFSTGETDLQNHDDGVHMEQEAKLRRAVAFALELCCQSALGHPLPEGFDFQFSPLRPMNLGSKVETAAKGASAIGDAYDKGIIGRKQALQELRALSPVTGVFSNITDEDIEAAEPAPPSPIETAPLLLDPADTQGDVSGRVSGRRAGEQETGIRAEGPAGGGKIVAGTARAGVGDAAPETDPGPLDLSPYLLPDA